MTSEPESDLPDQVRAWAADDPDPAARAELAALLDQWPGSAPELIDRFSGPLTFGTAGLRGRLRAGPNGMNLAVVRGAAAGLVSWLAGRGAPGPLVIGYDARHGSARFAEETARVVTGAGRAALLLPGPLPTPVLAFAVRWLDAAAGVMVTASHNPPQDNGYKVYLGAAARPGRGGDGAQLAPPLDAEIEAAIRAVGPLSAISLGPPGRTLDDSVIKAYVEGARSVVDPGSPRELAIAYTPLHGVGAGLLAEVLAAAGFPAARLVAVQAAPDPDFPTVAFPNPEEPGAMDLVLALAGATGADLAIANDPDADRCAVAVPDRAGGRWRALRGDELGVLLADHLMRRGTLGRYATTLVSSAMLGALCAARGHPYAETLTGFKWIVRADPELAYGYEEALGYCVAPDLVRDKDGLTAALLACELAAGLRAQGRTLLDRLDELAAELGVYETDQLSARVPSLAELTAAMRRLRAAPPAALAGTPVAEVVDLLPAGADVVVLRAGPIRVVVRPSGTEPKLKVYLEVVEPAPGLAGLAAARARTAATLAGLRTTLPAELGIRPGS